MEEKININPWNIVSYSDHYELNPFEKVSTIIMEDSSGDYFFIKDEYEKIIDVSKMPDYIRKDWINYNKKDLSISIVNNQIKRFESDLNDPVNIGNRYEFIENTLKLLKSIRRDLIIKGVI